VQPDGRWLKGSCVTSLAFRVTKVRDLVLYVRKCGAWLLLFVLPAVCVAWLRLPVVCAAWLLLFALCV
jgi:hypothetical protein